MTTDSKVNRRSYLSKVWICLATGILFFYFPISAQAQTTPRPNFNHDSTSFQLQGAHRILDCKQCHSGGRYKGTPRTCEECHNGQISYGKPASHLMTNQSCMFCHSQNAWIPSTFTHDPSTAGQCSNCHNGQKATGKPSNHVPTTSQCDTCHRTTAWVPAGFNHANLMGQLCSSCHKIGGPGMPPPTNATHSNLGSQDCSQCHKSTSSFAGAAFDHTNLAGQQCKSCHFSGNSSGAMVPPTTAGNLIHNPLSNIITDCNSCHTSTKSGGFSSYKMVHSAIFNYSSTCQNCHKAGNPMGAVYKSNHNVGLVCGNCHSTSTFSK
ncbi:MAG: hypothetical protein HY200_01680 [Nitrospirae bacterium]|nr:hypothetical protein [Nitrospirota bacterium]